MNNDTKGNTSMSNRDEKTHEISAEVFAAVIEGAGIEGNRYLVYDLPTGKVYAEKAGDTYRMVEIRA